MLKRSPGSFAQYYFPVLFIVLLLCNVFIFRDLVFSFFDSMQGDVMTSREELVPIFDIQSQFVDQMRAGKSSLTSSPEIRVSYAALTAWARLNTLLPLTLVLFSTASITIVTYSFYYFCRRVLHTRPDIALQAAVFPGLSLGFIVLYSKIAHFYTLLLGFSLFSLALVLTIDLFFREERIKFVRLLGIALLVLLNPAIHYHILYYIASAFLISCFVLVGNRFYGIPLVQYWNTLRLYSAVVALSLLPYAAFIYFITSAMGQSVTDAIPIDYWIIYYASIPIEYLFSLNMPGHVDLFLHGNYISPNVKYSGIVLTVLAITAILFSDPSDTAKRRTVIVGLVATYALSLWMSAGYIMTFSLHSTMGLIVSTVSDSSTAVGSFIESVLFLLLQILRYPHRFEFILFVIVGLLASTAIVGIFSRFNIFRNFLAARILFIAVLLLVFFSNADYRWALASGDFNGFMAPMQIPEDLKDIRQLLSKLPAGKMMVLPSLESGRALYTGTSEVSFLDKTLIYYLNQPSLYYGAGASIENKIAAINVYTALSNDDDWWDEIVFANLNIQYILIPRTRPRERGVVYLPGIDAKINRALEKSDVFEKLYDGPSFDLYRARIVRNANPNPTLLSVSNLTDVLGRISTTTLTDAALYLPFEMDAYLKNVRDHGGRGSIITDRREDVEMDLITAVKGGKLYPNKKRLPFDSKIVNSSFYFSNTFSYFTLLDEGNAFNHFQDIPPYLMNVANPYFYQVADEVVLFEFQVMEPTEVRIVIRGTQLDKASVSLDAVPMPMRASLSSDAEDYHFFSSENTFTLQKGMHRIEVGSVPGKEHAPIIEYASVIPIKRDSYFTLTQMSESMYQLELRKN